jgi:N-acyl-D-amino-acid deacylase
LRPLNAAMMAADRAGYDHLKITPDWTRFAAISRGLKSRAWESTWPAMWAQPVSGGWCLGDADVQPNAEQLAAMQAAGRRSDAGWGGGCLDRAAIRARALCQNAGVDRPGNEAGKYGGIYATHMRSEGDAVLESIDEAARIGKEGHIPVEIWHLKAAGKANWGRMPQIVEKIQSYRDAGLDISANTYAYTAWFNTFSAFIPPWAHDGGDAKLVERLKDPRRGRGFARTCWIPKATGITSGRRFPAPRRF